MPSATEDRIVAVYAETRFATGQNDIFICDACGTLWHDGDPDGEYRLLADPSS